MRRIIICDVIAQFATVFVGHLKAVFLQQSYNFIVKIDKSFRQYVPDLRLADFELAQGVKVDLVDRTARSNESYEHALL